MSNYKSIKGTTIKEFSIDPITLPVGQMWFNSSTSKFKIYSNAPYLAAWSMAANTPIYTEGNGGFGTQTAAVFAGGYNTDPLAYSRVESWNYDGNVYTASSNMGTDRGYMSGVGAGTQTAGLIAGGYIAAQLGGTNLTEEYDGSTWTFSGNMIAAPYEHSMRGTQTAAVASGSYGTELYDGTSWTSGGIHIHPGNNFNPAAGGTQTALIQAGGGMFSTYLSDSYFFDGTTWTSGPTRMIPRNTSGGFGTQTAFNINGGFQQDPFIPEWGGIFAQITELYDGTVWSTSASQGVSHNMCATAGNSSAGISMGGNPGDYSSYLSYTEELNATGGPTLTEL